MAAETSEIVIVGGGIAGCATALYLARAGHEVTLLERDHIAAEASGVNMGGLGGSGWGNPPDLEGYLTVGSLELFKTLQLDLGYDIEFRQCGTLQAVQTEAELAFARDVVESARRHGRDLELITAREAAAIEPGVNRMLPGYIYAERRGQADPVKATNGFAAAARAAGAAVVTGAGVDAIVRGAAGTFELTATGRRFACATLVIAAGAWAAEVGRLLGLEIPIVPVRGQMWATAPLPPCVFHTISATESPLAWHREADFAADEPPALTHRGSRRVARHLYGRQNAAGEVIFGGDRHAIGYARSVDTDGIGVNKAHAGEVLPFLERVPIERTWCGLMPFSLDGAPLIGAIDEGVYVVGGLASSGFGRGPMAAKLLAEAIHTGHPHPLLAEADPRRWRG